MVQVMHSSIRGALLSQQVILHRKEERKKRSWIRFSMFGLDHFVGGNRRAFKNCEKMDYGIMYFHLYIFLEWVKV